MTREEIVHEASKLGAVPIQDFERYFITDTGLIYSSWGNKLRKINGGSYNGYRFVYLSKKGKMFKKFVHKLVAEAFIPNTEHKTQVDHIDTNRMNNNVCNLRWSTPKENRNNTLTILHTCIAGGGSGRKIVRYSFDGEVEGIFLTPLKASQSVGKNSNVNIQRCCDGVRLQAYGKIWRYEGDGFNKYKIPKKKSYISVEIKEVCQFTKDNHLICVYKNALEAERKTGICHVNILSCCKGRKFCHTAGGYVWKFLQRN